jgi:hypothetical protein
VKGLYLRNAHFNKENHFIEEEQPHEFENELEMFLVLVTSKNNVA